MTLAEQKYLRAIYQISQTASTEVFGISELAYYLDLKPPTVLERLKQLRQQKYIAYTRSKGISLTATGHLAAMQLVRRHRIWETFLQKVCAFSWTEVHELAEQLQSIDSEKLIDRLFELSGKPEFDPHGDPIPSKSGRLPQTARRALSKSVVGCNCVVLGVNEDSVEFLEYLSNLKIALHTKVQVEKIFPFDGSMQIRYNGNLKATLSPKVTENLLVACSTTLCKCKKQASGN